jgi:hypothetical protein
MPVSGGLGIAVDLVSATQLLPLGFEYEEPASAVGDAANRGTRVWVYVQNTSGGLYAPGNVIGRAAGDATYSTTLTAPSMPSRGAVGCAQFNIPDTRFAFVLKRGTGLVLAGPEGIAPDLPVLPSLVAPGVGAAVLAFPLPWLEGFAWAFAGAPAGTTAPCYIDCAGG